MISRVAYIVSWFPKLTETFVLFELLAVERQGVAVELYPLRRARGGPVHPEAEALLDRVRFTPLLSPRFLPAHLHYLLRKPRTYLGALLRLVAANLGSRRYLLAALAFFPKAVYLARRIERDGAQHVHAHFASHPAAVAWLVGRLTGLPYSFTAHGSDLHRDQHMLREKVAGARFIVTISEYNHERIVEVCGAASRAKIHVIHCGADTAAIVPREAAEGDGPLHVICVGTLHAVKGQRVLIEACRLLRERGVQLQCELVGDGPDRAMLEQAARAAGLDGSLVLHGSLRRAQVLERLRGAGVLAAPSVPTADGRREGIPVAIIEGMALGLPVVASDLSGIPELVQHERTGLLVPPGDAGALAEALLRLHGDRALASRLARAGRSHVEQQFDLQREVARLVALFRGDPP